MGSPLPAIRQTTGDSYYEEKRDASEGSTSLFSSLLSKRLDCMGRLSILTVFIT